MANEATVSSNAAVPLRTTQVCGMAGVCLVAGLAIGYLLQGSQSGVPPAKSVGNAPLAVASSMAAPPGMAQNAGNPGQPAAHAGAMPANHAAMAARRMPTLQEMKQMADKQAAPLLEKLKTNPKDSATLAQVGAIYHATHQFKEAAEYYRRAAEADPKNVALRTKLAISLYREGDVDQAIDQLSQALKQDPKDADALFNLGFIKLQGKQDSKGAIAAWQRLLKSNPQMSEDRKAEVQKLMAAVLTNMANQQPVQEAGGHESTK